MQAMFSRCDFILSAAAPAQFPPPLAPEVAFAGRSNAGKSSALNAITGRRNLARTSKTPGRTQLINFFRLGNETGRLVDLPGYGFARVPEAVRGRWRGLIESYLRGRDTLRGVVLLMDIRHPLTEFDEQMLAWCASLDLPCHCLLTKADKLSHGAGSNVLLKTRRQIEQRGGGATAQLFSAVRGTGVDEARAHVVAWLELEPPSVA